MISIVNDESGPIPPRRRCAGPTSRFTAARSEPAGAAGHSGQHRGGGASGGDGRDTRDQAARRGIRRNWARSGTTPVAAVRASRIVRKGRATPAAGGREGREGARLVGGAGAVWGHRAAGCEHGGESHPDTARPN